MHRFYRTIKLLVSLFLFLCVVSTLSAEVRSGIGIDVRPSYPFSSYKDDIMETMIDTEDARKSRFAASLHLKYNLVFSPDTPQGRYFPGAWQGIGAGVNLFGNPHGLGTPVSVYLFQGAPVWRIKDGLDLYYEWNFGLSAGWKPSDGHTARSNLIVGSKVNAYINVGAGLRWSLGDHYSLTAGIDLTHFSNGNTSYPNPGVNMAGVRVGVTRMFGNERKVCSKLAPPSPDTLGNERRFGIDLTLYGAWRKRVYRGGEEPVLLNGHYMVLGAQLNPMWRVGRVFRVGPSLDVQWDESTDLKRNYAEGTDSETIKFYRPDVGRQICYGLSARGELVMPFFSVNLGIGYNFIGPEETRASYQMANLKIRLVKGLYANIGYQLLNFQKQNNLMLGMGYSF